MLTFLKSKYLPWVLVSLALAYLCLSFYQEHTKQKSEDTKQAAIENPATLENKVIERVVTKIVTVEGETKTVTKEIVKWKKESIPVVPVNKINTPSFYLSGNYGMSIAGESIYGVGIGYYIIDNVAVGCRYIHTEQENILAVELTIRF